MDASDKFSQEWFLDQQHQHQLDTYSKTVSVESEPPALCVRTHSALGSAAGVGMRTLTGALVFAKLSRFTVLCLP